MRIRKILGKVIKEGLNHSVAKLENGRYAVGQLVQGQKVEVDSQFETLDAAFDYWLATLPTHTNATGAMRCSNGERWAGHVDCATLC